MVVSLSSCSLFSRERAFLARVLAQAPVNAVGIIDPYTHCTQASRLRGARCWCFSPSWLPAVSHHRVHHRYKLPLHARFMLLTANKTAKRPRRFDVASFFGIGGIAVRRITERSARTVTARGPKDRWKCKTAKSVCRFIAFDERRFCHLVAKLSERLRFHLCVKSSLSSAS